MKHIIYIRMIFLLLFLNFRSVGNQIMTQKKTEPQINVGKSTRESDRKLGMFPSTMSKQPTRIRIEHPKI
jgi:hypothetical protein